MEQNVKITVTLEAIAERHSLNIKTLRRWSAERRFPLYKISNRIRVSPEEFDQWLQQFHIKGTHKEV